ncbi:MAG: fumarylacetoacetate hydrolase family protein [Ferrimonas sp.]
MTYQAHTLDNQVLPLPLGKIVCVGRNYAAHAEELNHPLPQEPLLFIKPNSAFAAFDAPINVSDRPHGIHYELEIAVLITEKLTKVTPEQARAGIGGLGLALDLTYRDLQQALSADGEPWEKSKGFDDSCPVTPFVSVPNIDLGNLQMKLTINGECRQQGDSADMLTGVLKLLSFISSHFTLLPGDIVLTGTPAGVGALNAGDSIEAELDGVIRATGHAV